MFTTTKESTMQDDLPTIEDALPTIEECQEFLRLVNVGREAMGLDALEYLDYDDATPGSCTNCLSARNLFRPAGMKVGSSVVLPITTINHTVLDAIGAEGVKIPDAIRKITDPFDERMGERPYAPDLLRARMVEAGVVRP